MSVIEIVLLLSPTVLLLGLIGAAFAGYGSMKHWQGTVDARLDQGGKIMDDIKRRLTNLESQ